ncbi:L-aspartate oxidase [Tundrisphaera sp. TA3]|uniref:L-aspartate oxidase n=1 Tax=Tundrisphaera sp. TA3 TaxID=3435775 RepID=UPI003EB936F5
MIQPLVLPRRYLIDFDPRDLPHHFVDVLIVGGGVAGLRAALGVPDSHRVLVVTKDEVRESNSTYAQGGIAGVLDPEDHFEDHIADTLAAGKGLCDPETVELVVREAPGRINELIAWGTAFDQRDGQVALTREGGHSHARIVHALGDATGIELMRAVIQKARARPNVRIWQNSFTIDLLTHDGMCRGALVWDRRRGPTLIWARATVLATGGAGQLFRETTNPGIATADGHALAYRAGAELRDMEFMQFHPTVLYIAGSSRHLLTEALRGEGAYLRDRAGVRFMPEYHPDAELAPRDDVSRAIVDRMAKTQHPNVYLDLSHLDPDYVRARFPGIAALCRGFDLDITRDPIPVRPGAHYMIGGVTIDKDGRTDLPGLWAAGEVTSSGLHGANRLASNSLLEGLVHGARAAEDIARTLGKADPARLEVPPISAQSGPGPARSPLDLADIRESLRALMWRSVGITRDARGLSEAAEQVDFWCRYALDQTFDGPDGWTLQNMLTVARLMIAAADGREESRGVHTRRDFPATDSAWARHLAFHRPPFVAERADADGVLSRG